MRLKIFPWLGQEFISLSWEGSGNGTVEDEARELMTGFATMPQRLFPRLHPHHLINHRRFRP